MLHEVEVFVVGKIGINLACIEIVNCVWSYRSNFKGIGHIGKRNEAFALRERRKNEARKRGNTGSAHNAF